MQAANLSPIEVDTDDGIAIHCEDEGNIPLNELAMCQGDSKELLPFLVDNDAGWMAETSAIFPIEEISIPNFGNLESPGSVPSLTWSPQFHYQSEHTSPAPMSQASSDTPTQSSLDDFHRMWPHIHQFTTQYTPSSGLLGQALQSVAYNTTNILDTVNLDEIAGRLLLSHPSREQSSSVSLYDLQVLSVVLITTVSQEMTPAVTTWATQWIEIAVSAMRRLGILINGSWRSPNSSSGADDEAWARGEESKRLVYTMLRIDTYLSIITGRPPSLRIQELELPLPVTEDLWRAPTIEARRQLYWFEPAGRTWTTLSAIVRDSLIQSRNQTPGTTGMPPLLPADSHLVLCGLQGEIWATAQETYNLSHGTLDSRPSWHVPESVHFWHGCLVDWKTIHHRPEQSSAQTDDRAWNSLNTIQFHLCQLTLHAPLSLLESRQCCTRCRAADITAMLRDWASSLEARRAVYHAVQLQRFFDSQAGFVNPLQSPALLASSVVLCNYAAESNPLPKGDPVELYKEEVSGLAAIEKWVQYGGPSMVSGRMLCAKNLQGLLLWCQQQLVMFPQSLARMRAFMAMLS